MQCLDWQQQLLALLDCSLGLFFFPSKGFFSIGVLG